MPAKSDTSDLRESIFADYRMKTRRSGELFRQANKVLPGGVSGNLRYIDPYPFYVKSALGSRLTDVDGNEYIDCFGCNGPMLLGHNHPEIVDSRAAVASLGHLVPNPDLLVECAATLVNLIASADQVRFLNTGTEAVIMAVRYARAFTGREEILKFHGHYHGQQDPVMLGLDLTDAPVGDGIPESATASTVLATYGDLEQVRSLLESDHNIAAVILDPAMHAGGLWGSDKEFLGGLRELTELHGVLLIFDEVITGFRVAPGGAQQKYEIRPDLTTFAKALAAGEKLAAVAGRRDVMSVVDPNAPAGTPRVFQSGTVNDGTAALASATAAMRMYSKLYESGEYQALEKRSSELKARLIATFKEHGIPCQINQIASMLQLYIAEEPVTFEMATLLDTSLLQLFYTAMINEGVLLSVPSSNHIYLSFAHSNEDFEAIERAAHRVLDRYGFGKYVD